MLVLLDFQIIILTLHEAENRKHLKLPVYVHTEDSVEVIILNSVVESKLFMWPLAQFSMKFVLGSRFGSASSDSYRNTREFKFF